MKREKFSYLLVNSLFVVKVVLSDVGRLGHKTKPFLTKTEAHRFIKRSTHHKTGPGEAWKYRNHIDHECVEHDCVHEEVREYCVDGCFEEGRSICEHNPADGCVCDFFMDWKCYCPSTKYCYNWATNCPKLSKYTSYGCSLCPSEYEISNCIARQNIGCHQKSRCATCDTGYYLNSDDWQCPECPSITYCQSVVCTNPSDVTCTKCQDPDLYKLDNGNKECAHKCSWSNRWCWPGVCGSDYAKHCSCESGFRKIYDSSKATCQLDPSRTAHKPDIMECLIKVFSEHGDAKPERGGSSECSKQTDFYGNFQVHHVTAKSTFEFSVHLATTTRPAFVTHEMFGLTDASMIMFKKSVNDMETQIKNTTLKDDPNGDFPKNILTKDINETNTAALNNGESLCFRFFAKAGGHLVSKNVQNHNTWKVQYDKTQNSRDVCYIYDNMKPSHCFESGTCTNEPLVLSDRRLRGTQLKATFNGYVDPIPVGATSKHASQIENYRITVYETKESGENNLKVGTKPVLKPEPVASNVLDMDITLPNTNHPVLYAVVLEVKDIADNVRQARRFVLFDNSSAIEFREDKPFLVTSASDNTNYKWQTHHGDLCFNWTDRFHNNKYIHTNLLKPITAAPPGLIQGVYDQNTGILPVSGTPNVNGITSFVYSLLKETSVIQANITVPNFTSQTLCVSTAMNDGDTFWLILASIDIMDNSYEDRINVHIDASVPEINNIWLVKDGYRRLFVHNSIDLSKMVLEFDVFDPHSGIFSVHWGFGTTDGGFELGHGSLGVHKLNESCGSVDNCYCPSVGPCEYSNYTLLLNSLVHNNTHIGNHNRQYFFTIRVINNAQLVSIERVDILADDSPPQPGVVQEGPLDGPDIDYTSDNQVIVHWHGFMDHESGIKLYKVGLADTCLIREQIEDMRLNGSNINVKHTTETSIVLPISSVGKHFVTVLAYNNAMEPSVPVCSDGIVYDNTAPIVTNVALSSAIIAKTVACVNGTAWFINDNVTRTRLNDTTSCLNRCNGSGWIDFVMSLPEYLVSGRDDAVSDFMCDRLESYSNHMIYVPSDTIELKWDIDEDLSQIRDVYVGFGTSDDSRYLPDIVGYQKSKHKLWYRDRHSSLSSGTEMFAFVKVVNKAGLETIITYGPILIDETPPICPSSLQPELNGTDVMLMWNSNSFYDLEQKEQIGSIFFRIGHLHSHVTPFLQWKINESQKCFGIKQECIRYPIRRLQHFDTELGLPFKIELHAYNYAGHYCTITSQPFTLPSLYPPGHGIVIDLDPDSDADESQDTDYVLKTTKVCAAWKGFLHHRNVIFSIGVGRVKGTDDMISFHPVGSDSSYCYSSHNLIPFQTYYTTVIAECSGGTTVSSSDGFTIIDSVSVLNSMNVYDGPGCSDKNKVIDIRINAMLQENAISNIHIQRALHAGKTYTFEIQSNHTEFILQSPHLLDLKKSSKDSDIKYQGIVIKSKPDIEIRNTGPTMNIQKIIIYACEEDVDDQTSTDTVEVHWSINKTYEKHISHYIIGLLSDCQNNITDKCTLVKTSKVSKSTHWSFNDLNLNAMFYKTFVQPCLNNLCLDRLESNGVTIGVMKPIIGTVTAHLSAIQDTCYVFSLEWEALTCSIGNNRIMPSFYRWAVFRDFSGKSALSNWNEVVSANSDNEHDSKCIRFPLYPHSDMYIRVEGFCKSGMSSATSVLVFIEPDPNLFPKLGLYDINAKSDFMKHIQTFLYSKNIGPALSYLHTNELDFANSSATLGGIIPGVGDRTVTWFLMTRPNITVGQCDSDKDCVLSFETTYGYVEFKHTRLEHDRIYYICATAAETVIERELFSETLDEFSICSDGVYIDNTKPVHGTVEIISSEGYITDGSEMILQWQNFTESEKYIKMGYPSDIQKYMYAIGSYPHGQDVVPFTDVGLSENIIHKNLSLRPGKTYYASVKAVNHVGMSVTSVSDGVIFDNTPPKTGMIHVGGILKHDFIASNDITVHWMNFQDPESGIATFEVGIGTTMHSPDILPFQVLSGDFTVLKRNNLFHDGHRYYVILKTTNRAGLSSSTSSQPFMIDTTPPKPGVVRHGATHSQADVDYQQDTIRVNCHWTDFTDPHSHISYYKVGLGTEPGEADIFPFYNVGLKKEMTWKSHFEVGQRYYVTVEACNGALLCTKASSNGVIMDNSPPVSGLVHVGITGSHSKYISHKHTLQAHLLGFLDPQSDIHHFEACVGTATEMCDIKSFTNFLLSSSLIFTQLNMPVGKHLYVTVRAFNNIGLYVDHSSDAFIIDITPPLSTVVPIFDLEGDKMSYNSKTQWEVSLLKVKWEFKDSESPIIRQTVSLFTHHDGHAAKEDIELTSENHLTVTLDPKNWLRNGDKYHVNVTACNSASLCTSASSSEILIDSTPPHLGGFKPPLTWTQNIDSKVKLTWYGFIDVESLITQYYITIGKTYSGSELSGGVLKFPHKGPAATDQVEEISLVESLSVGQKIFLSIWAENGAVLLSSIGKITTEVVATDVSKSNGKLLIEKHSCDVEYCNKDCTCAVIGRKCADVIVNTSCIAVNNQIGPDISVNINSHQNFLASSACLSANWFPNNSSSSNTIRYEWSFGIENEDAGVGIFDKLTESAWYDVELQRHVVHCLPIGRQLVHENLYVAYVRAWISNSEYRVFKSASVTIDQTPPSVRKGRFVKDSDQTCLEDIDYTSNAESITACWTGIFSEQQSQISYYHAYLGTSPGADDIIAIQNVGLKTNITWENLKLQQGTKYYITVKATNVVELQTVISSDGFIVDNKNPFKGVVFNTQRHKNIHVQSSTETFGVSWHGFEDSESHINSYKLVILPENNTVSVENITFQDVGIVNSLELKGLELMHGIKYVAAVKAVDAAGHESGISFSEPLLIDTTPPETFSCNGYNKTLSTTINGTTKSYFTWNDTIDMLRYVEYKLYLEVQNVHLDIMATFTAEQFAIVLPFSKQASGSLLTEFEFLSPFEGSIPVSVSINGVNKESVITMEFYSCNEMINNHTDTSNVVMSRQISPHSISICIKARDDESGIRHVFVGAGTTQGGFQVRPLSPSSLTSHLVIDVNLTHGSPLYVTALVENYAKIKSIYSSRKLIIDHTSPFITHVKPEIFYNYGNTNDTDITRNVTTKIQLSWKVQDEESGVKICFCALGTSEGSANLQSWTEATENGLFISNQLILQHGQKLYPTVQCINNIELSQVKHVSPVTIAYNSPDVTSAKMEFVTETHGCTSNTVVQRNDSTVQLLWTDINDSADVTYQCRIMDENMATVDWINVGLRTGVELSDLVLKDRNYSVEVQAINSVGLNSSISRPITIETDPPEITGPVIAKKMTDTTLSIQWSGTFDVKESLLLHYILIAGTNIGYCDLIRYEVLTEKEYVIDIVPSITEIYVSLTAVYCTGNEATVKQKIKF